MCARIYVLFFLCVFALLLYLCDSFHVVPFSYFPFVRVLVAIVFMSVRVSVFAVLVFVFVCPVCVYVDYACCVSVR